MLNAGGHYRKQSVRFEQPEADPQGEVILEGVAKYIFSLTLDK